MYLLYSQYMTKPDLLCHNFTHFTFKNVKDDKSSKFVAVSLASRKLTCFNKITMNNVLQIIPKKEIKC